jgi:hypothetical protein
LRLIIRRIVVLNQLAVKPYCRGKYLGAVDVPVIPAPTGSLIYEDHGLGWLGQK